MAQCAAAAAEECLAALGLPAGFLPSFLDRCATCRGVTCVLDNSGGMRAREGHLAHRGTDGVSLARVDGVSRWCELKESVLLQAHAAAASGLARPANDRRLARVGPGRRRIGRGQAACGS